MPRFHPLEVTDVRRETRDAVVVTLKPNDGDGPLFELASRPGEFHPQALLEPYVKLSLHTAPDAQPPTNVLRPGLIAGLLPFPVGPELWLSNAAPLVQSHCRTFTPTTSRSAPVPRIGTLVLAVSAARTSPFASERQVLTFHTRA